MCIRNRKRIQYSLFFTLLLASCATSSTTSDSSSPKVTTTISKSATTTTTTTTTTTYPEDYKFGDLGPMGGRIFYVADSVQPWGKYLEAYPDAGDWRPIEDYLQWGCYGNNGMEKNGIKIGDGWSNSEQILKNGCSQDLSGSDSSLTSLGLIGTSKGAWFIPSLAEMNELWKLDREQRLDMYFNDNSYWTSSVIDPSTAWVTDGGTMEWRDRHEIANWWLIRAF